jgi:hypothetical protein
MLIKNEAQRTPDPAIPTLGGGKEIDLNPPVLVDDAAKLAADKLATETAAKAELEKKAVEELEAKKKLEQQQSNNAIDKLSNEDFIKSIENKSFDELTDDEKKSAETRGIKLEVDIDDETGVVELFKESFKLINSNFDDKELANYDLTTPEGVRDLMLKQQNDALLSWEQNLKKKFPREYEALALASNGKDPSVLYAPTETSDLINLELKDKAGVVNKEAEKAVYRGFLKSTGTPADDIEDLIQLAEDKGTLSTKAADAQGKLKAAEQQRVTQISKEREEQEKYEQDIIDGFETAIENKLKTGVLGNIKLSENLKVDFIKYLSAQNIEVKEDDLYISRKITPSTLDEELQALFYAFKKGDLKDIAQTIAKSEQVIKLKGLKSKTRGGNQTESKGTEKLKLNIPQ